jgi:opacity protein-like surface antigen
MGPSKMLAFAGAATAFLATTAASAADFPIAPGPQVRAPIAEASGWYLRGDIGVGSQNFKSYDFTQTAGGAWPASWRIDQKDIKDAFFFGGGVGYAFNNWLRFDVTGEYRADVKWKAVGSYDTGAPSGRAFDVYDGDHSAAVFLANMYLDLGTWWCITPFIGAGVGAAYHRVSAVSDAGLNADGFGSSAFGYASADRNKWSLAWAVHAGLAYTVTPNFKIELAYRYLNMGSAETAEVDCGSLGCGVGTGPRAFYTLKNFDSHDLKLGVRWMLQPEPQPAPLMRRG